MININDHVLAAENSATKYGIGLIFEFLQKKQMKEEKDKNKKEEKNDKSKEEKDKKQSKKEELVRIIICNNIYIIINSQKKI